MAEFVNTIDVIGDEALIDSIIDGSITEYIDDATKTVGSYAFCGCVSLAKVDLTGVTNFAYGSFRGCTSLTTLILRNMDTLVDLSTKDAITGTPITSKTGYVYVPRDLVDTYKEATNWSTYAAQIRAIEDYPDICGG